MPNKLDDIVNHVAKGEDDGDEDGDDNGDDDDVLELTPSKRGASARTGSASKSGKSVSKKRKSNNNNNDDEA